VLPYTPKREIIRLGIVVRVTITQVSVPGIMSIRGVSSTRPVIGRATKTCYIVLPIRKHGSASRLLIYNFTLKSSNKCVFAI
jgi:hypothetical protein